MIARPPRPDLDLASLVRTIPDFPKPGIQFRDITTLIGDAAGFSESVRRLSARAATYRPDLIVAVEARGFLFGAAMARSEEHTSELQSLMRTSYAVFCLTKKNDEISYATRTTSDTEKVQRSEDNTT